MTNNDGYQILDIYVIEIYTADRSLEHTKVNTDSRLYRFQMIQFNLESVIVFK